jgi:hypothetical protein
MKLLMPGLLIAVLLAAAVFTAPPEVRAAEISIGLSVRVGPPPIPVYVQPVCPGPGYMWTPGYWAYDPDNGYFWVPGTWVLAPAPGLYWTPGYWGWSGTVFIFHAGYWGPHVGFYGGINYGFGYTGVGFAGGEWRGGTFYYNRSVANVGGAHITNVYYRRVDNNFAANRISYNGGAGGLNARPGREEIAAEHDRHIGASSAQQQHEMAAHNDRTQFASYNHGAPGVAATARPGEFRGAGVVQASRSGGSFAPGASHGSSPSHPAGYSGFHYSNPSGGSNHPTTTSNAYHPGSTASSSPPRGPAPGEFHPAPPSHGGPTGGPASSPKPSVHQGQPAEHGSKPSGGGKDERHESEPHH